VNSTNELFAKAFYGVLGKEVSDFVTTVQKARMNMDILERQTDSIRRELNGAAKRCSSSQRQYVWIELKNVVAHHPREILVDVQAKYSHLN
jgi:hypothetical protein